MFSGIYRLLCVGIRCLYAHVFLASYVALPKHTAPMVLP
jgi:hypothetical protein